MKIFFVRHGHANSDGLDELGVRQIHETADFLKQQGLDSSQVRLLTSELTRAVKTAEIICKILGCPEHERVAWLTSGKKYDIPACIADFFQTNPQCQTIIAVSHLPEIAKTLEIFAKNFGINFSADPENGSVYLADTNAKKVQMVFQPNLK